MRGLSSGGRKPGGKPEAYAPEFLVGVRELSFDSGLEAIDI